MKKLAFLIAIVALCSCTSKEEVKPNEVNNFIGKKFQYQNILVPCTLEFTTDSKCVYNMPIFYDNQYYTHVMDYTYSENTAVLNSPEDDCFSHDVKYKGDFMLLIHDDGRVDKYYLVE